MKLVGARGQGTKDVVFSVSGQTTSAAPKMLVVPEHRQRTMLQFQNLSSNVMYLEFGCGEATCTISGGSVATVTVVNGGFNYTIPPVVQFMGGGYDGGNTTFVGTTAPDYGAPNNVAVGTAVLSGGVVTSIALSSGGSGYIAAPYVLLTNSPQDPNGVADPSVGSGSGVYLAGGGFYYVNGTTVPTSPLAVYCATSGSRWQCKWAN